MTPAFGGQYSIQLSYGRKDTHRYGGAQHNANRAAGPFLDVTDFNNIPVNFARRMFPV